MDSSVHQRLIESTKSDNFQDLEDEDGIDESHCMYVLNAILSGTARLNVLLPSFTILAFTIFAPILTDDGRCSTLNHWLMGIFWALSAASCVFFSITDSFKTPTGRLYYGVATFSGIWTFNGGRKRPLVPQDYRLRWSDLFHSSLSLMAFLTFAASHSDVVQCYYPKMSRKVTNTVPLVVGFVVSLLFVMFPSRRRGIAYPFLLQRNALYSRIEGTKVPSPVPRRLERAERALVCVTHGIENRGAPAIPTSEIVGCGMTLDDGMMEGFPLDGGIVIVLLKQLAITEHFPSFSELDTE
ncbi:hypothetical protein Ancab_036593 [Ancistrocladus abbreviatus]